VLKLPFILLILTCFIWYVRDRDVI
jgi:hypothetical protein